MESPAGEPCGRSSVTPSPIKDIFVKFQALVEDEYSRLRRQTQRLATENSMLKFQVEVKELSRKSMDDMVGSLRQELTKADYDDDVELALDDSETPKDSLHGQEGINIGDTNADCVVAPNTNTDSSTTLQETNTDCAVAPNTNTDLSTTLQETNTDCVLSPNTNIDLSTTFQEERAKTISRWQRNRYQRTMDKIREMLGYQEGQDSVPFVATPAFETFATGMIICNSVLVAVETDMMSSRTEPIPIMDILGVAFNAFYLAECILRLKTFRWKFFTGTDYLWNLFDAAIVVAGLADSCMLLLREANNSINIAGLKAMKVLRVMRLIRIFRFFRQMSLLALMLLSSVVSLVWSSLLFFLIVFVFALTLTGVTSDWLKHQTAPSGLGWKQDLEALGRSEVMEVHKFFGDLGRSFYTLIQLSLNGMEWGEVTTVMSSTVGWSTSMLLILYVLFTVIAMLNIFTGVFVENALNSAKRQREVQLDDEIQKHEALLSAIKELFTKLDRNSSTTICRDEAKVLLADPIVVAYLSHIGLDVDGASRLFDLFDTDVSGEVSFDEFLKGCKSMRGTAKSLDLHLLMADLKAMLVDIHDATTKA